MSHLTRSVADSENRFSSRTKYIHNPDFQTDHHEAMSTNARHCPNFSYQCLLEHYSTSLDIHSLLHLLDHAVKLI